MINPNDNTAIHREIIINLENNTVTEIINPGGKIVFDTIKHNWLDKSINDERVVVYQCDPIESDGGSNNSGSSGTAFFVSNKGHLLTNNHVVEGCNISKITSWYDLGTEPKILLVHSWYGYVFDSQLDSLFRI